MKTQTLIIIVPCLNEQDSIQPLIEACKPYVSLIRQKYNLTTDFLFVDDGSTDRTREILRTLSASSDHIGYLFLADHVGKEAAVAKGISCVQGDYIGIMDCDLQDPVTLLEDMVHAVKEEGYGCAAAIRTDRSGDKPSYSFLARCYYRVLNRLSRADIPEGARDYRIFTNRVRSEIKEDLNTIRFTKGVFAIHQIPTKWIEYSYIKRKYGKGKWKPLRLVGYGLRNIAACTSVSKMILWSGLQGICLGLVVSFVVCLWEGTAGNGTDSFRRIAVYGVSAAVIVILLFLLIYGLAELALKNKRETLIEEARGIFVDEQQ